MFPAILAAIQAVVGAKQKKEQEEAARKQAAAQGVAYQYPGQSNKLDTAMGLVGGLAGGLGGGKSDAMSDVDNALGGFDSYLGKRDEDDRWGGLK